MPNVTRSRARMYRGEADGPRGEYQPGNGRRYITYIVAAVVVIALAVAVMLTVKSCSAGTSTLPENSPANTDTVNNPGDTAEPTATTMPTATPDVSASPIPTESPLPGDSATPENTGTEQSESSATPDPGDTAEPDNTATAKPTQTTGSLGGSELEPGTIIGKPDVDEYLSLRGSASSSATILVKIQKGEEFTILQVNESKSWLKVKYSDKTGYVPASFVLIGADGTDKVCTITSATINVRKEAGTSHDIVGTLKSGDTVIVTDSVTESGDTWYKVTVGDTTGYVSAQYCRLAS